jgi:prepilin-type N-terminal cleavage/methylation domain-containing protein
MAAKRTLGRGRSKSRRSGFTLMEVLLVMAILVIMGTLVVANFSGILFKTRLASIYWNGRQCHRLRHSRSAC